MSEGDIKIIGDVIVFDSENVARLAPKVSSSTMERFQLALYGTTDRPAPDEVHDEICQNLDKVLELAGDEAQAGLISLKELEKVILSVKEGDR